MKRKLSLKGVISALMMALVMGAMGATMWGASLGAMVGCVAFAMPFMKAPKVVNSEGMWPKLNGIAVEVWQNHIEENLFKDNEFIMTATDASQYVMQGKVVHIPQAGGVVNVEKDRSSFPASVTDRTDTEVNYTLSAYSTDPLRIPNAEQYELSYDKRSSVLNECQSALNEEIADSILITWAPTAAGSILRTTGEEVATHLDSTTGTRKKPTSADLKRAQLTLNKQNIPATDRYCLMSSDMYSQFTDAMSESQYRDFSRTMDPATGVLGMLHGFKIMQRTSTAVYNSAASAVNALGAANAVDDNDSILCWHKGAIEYAKGSVTMFNLANDPTYYGDVHSFEVRFGGRRRRSDGKGIVAIVQAAGGAS